MQFKLTLTRKSYAEFWRTMSVRLAIQHVHVSYCVLVIEICTERFTSKTLHTTGYNVVTKIRSHTSKGTELGTHTSPVNENPDKSTRRSLLLRQVHPRTHYTDS
jgi:hypothetical protein